MKKILVIAAVLCSLVGCQNETLTLDEIESKYGEIKEIRPAIVQIETSTHSLQAIKHNTNYEIIWRKKSR